MNRIYNMPDGTTVSEYDPMLKPLTESARLLPPHIQAIFRALPFNDAALIVGGYEIRDAETYALLFEHESSVRLCFSSRDGARFLMAHYGISTWAMVGVSRRGFDAVIVDYEPQTA